MVKTTVENGTMSQAEIDEYIVMARENHPDKEIKEMHFRVDGEFVDIFYKWETKPFERIRRITGYLVGTLDRFNNGKRAEEHDRIKHDI